MQGFKKIGLINDIHLQHFSLCIEIKNESTQRQYKPNKRRKMVEIKKRSVLTRNLFTGLLLLLLRSETFKNLN